MSFSTTYDESKEYELLPEGDYECMIISARENATPGGYVYFGVRLVIRNDVPQNHQNRNIYHSIWEKKPENQTEDDKKVGGYSFKQLMNLAQNAGLPSGKSYETLNEMGEDLRGKCVIACVEHHEWKEKTSVRVKWFNKTKYPECKHTLKTSANSSQTPPAASAEGKMITILSDGDLPF